jgi:hypothetical protein
MAALRLAERKLKPMFEQSDAAIIERGRVAWQALQKNSTLAMWLDVGRALIAGRRLCMARAGIDKPRGVKYVRLMAEWLTQNGFRGISSSSRKCAASCAEHEKEVRAWLETLPEARRERMQHCAVVWYGYTGHRKRHSEPGGSRTRKPIDQKKFQAAVDAAREAIKQLGGNPLDALPVTIAVTRALGVSVPAPFLKAVTVVRRIGETEHRISLPRLRCLEDKPAAA